MNNQKTLKGMANMFDGKRKVRLMTYLSPGIPLELYQLYQCYLEETFHCESMLIVESRWSGPPTDRVDPLTADEADIVFMCSTGYLNQVQEKNQYAELLHAAPIHIHPKSELEPVYFSDVIVLKSKAKLYKTLIDLKGHTWAYNGEDSLSGNICIQAEIRRLGFNASFFANSIHSGSHRNSIKMVLEGTVDCAAVDSSTLTYFKQQNPEFRDKLAVVCSIGPLPIQPIVINSRLPDEVKQKITQAFLKMNSIPKYKQQLDKFNMWGFKTIDESLYDKEKEIKAEVKNISVHTVYY